MPLDAGLQRTLESWHDFYLLAGTAAATLMGLLFVSLSIHLEKVVGEGGAHLEAVAREAFSSFLIALALSLLLLGPVHSSRPLGVSVIILGAARAALGARRIRQLLRGRISAAERRGMALRFLFPLAASLSLVLAGRDLLRQHSEDGMMESMLATMLLLVDATRTAYELLVRTAQMELKSGRRRA